MRTLLAVILGFALGAGAMWIHTHYKNDPRVQAAGQKAGTPAKSAPNPATNKLQVLHLRPEDIKNELARTGQIARRAASDAGQAIADATADARITTAIKGKLFANGDLSSLNISVNTTAGVVTLSGAVPTSEHIRKAMKQAMETEGVTEVVSTLQVKPKAK
ncbi:MAG: BON domain-containing protein [Verrucomicrobia bacterium]|nr:BON domain-containing protein [Verrucomicrobiota bacterium]